MSASASRPLLIALVSITSVLVVAAVAVLLSLLVGSRPAVAIATTTPTPTATATPTPTAGSTPDPTVTIRVGPAPSTALAITSFSVSPDPVDCGVPVVNKVSVPMHVHWTSTGATRATLSINGAQLPFALPASGDDGDILAQYPTFAFYCEGAELGDVYESLTVTVYNGSHSTSETTYVARRVQ